MISDWDLQRLSFAYGNLACSTNHRPVRAAFEEVALGMGVSPEDFAAWAADREWWDDRLKVGD